MRSLFGPAATASEWLVAPIEVAVGFLYSWIAGRLLHRCRRPEPWGGSAISILPSHRATELRKAA